MTALPRMELRHIREWIIHHGKLGVDRIYLWTDRPVVNDFRALNKESRIFEKKPEANFNLSMTDEEVESVFREEVRAGEEIGGVRVLRMGYPDPAKSIGHRQAATYRRTFSERRDLPSWVFVIDADEFLVCPGGLEAFFSGVDDKVLGVRMMQKYFEGRFTKGGSAIPVYSIWANWGLARFNPKWAVRGTIGAVGFGTVHDPIPRGRHTLDASPEELRFHHFRGRPDFSGVRHGAPCLVGMGKYFERSSQPFSEPDRSHDLSRVRP